MTTDHANTADKLDAAITRANEMVLGASLAIMDRDLTTAQQDQGRYFQSLFSGIRDVLQDARRGYWNPGSAPEDWETFESSRAVLRMASAVLGEEAN